ncbi:transglutaminase domain-containing protein [Halorhabdus sp. BNX81]|uniref:transglutaminase domain-containing protein n=1 Tax=Halorhabdus sp. BNX81 TaxID=2980181 RepID=UPI0023DD6328|nr:transglutaminase domain-containing protein [Halorhabdus sp. BNX81]WEL22742.1 putative membrane protein [Halorhabdus sp. BNX81]
MSEDNSADGPAVGEAVFVVLTVVAVVLSAAFLPVFDVFDMLGGADLSESIGGGQGGGSGGATTPADSGEDTPLAESGAGSPVGSGLSLSQSPSELPVAGGRDPDDGLEKTPLFVVNSSRDTYWRQTAYMGYTGTGWTRSVETRPVEAGIPYDNRTVDGRTFDYRIELLTRAGSLPTAWQPDTVTLSNASTAGRLEASTVGGITSTQPLPSGTTYEARSATPPDDPSTLRAAGRSYPGSIIETYTQLPAETPDRVESFTRRLTADSRTPYDAARTVRDWLRTNKAYSLNTSIDTDEPIADQFLFEVEKGYCQHFATTMVVMLRSQGIPARYAVGFAGGEQVNENQYLVTSDRGHAWVEVYFPDVGWVTFEPTASGDLPVDIPQPPYNISLNRSAVAGAPVSVTVEKNDSSVVGAPVFVAGDHVGWTDSDGRITTRLPYVRNVTIVARPPGSGTKYDDRDDEQRVAVGSRRAPGPSPVGSSPVAAMSTRSSLDPRPGSVAQFGLMSGLQGSRRQTEDGRNESAETYFAETNGTIAVLDDQPVSDAALLSVTVEDVPVRNATVSVDGTGVGATNATGHFELPVASLSPGDYRVTATRGAVGANTTIIVAEPSRTPEPTTPEPTDSQAISLSVSPSLGIPLPFGPATVTATRQGEPIADVPVSVSPSSADRAADSTPVGRTDDNGTLGVTFPIADSVTVAGVGPGGSTAETTVRGLYANAVGGGTALVSTVVAVLVGLHLRGHSLQSIWTRIVSLSRFGVDALLRLSAAIVSAAQSLGTTLRQALTAFRSLSVLHPETWRRLLWLLDPRRLLAWLRGLFRRVGSQAETGEESARAAGAATTEDGTDDEVRAPPGLRALWRQFVSLVRPSRPSTRTPGEIGRRAVARGLPERPVRYLTALYRRAEYGGEQPDQSRIERARDALDSIRAGEDE